MKYLWLNLILLIAGASFCSSQMNKQDLHKDYEEFIRIDYVNDTILNLINENKFLYFITGHHGHIWSIVIQNGDRYILVAGNTRNNSWHIDTLFIDSPILTWGMDSLGMSCRDMRPVYRDFYWPFYEELVLFSAEKEKIFDCRDALCYSGIDSITFNKKLNRLKYYMYWFASPVEIQKKLPAPL